MNNKVKNFIVDESGPTATEYAVLLAAIFLVVIISVTIFGSTIGSMFISIKDAILS